MTALRVRAAVDRALEHVLMVLMAVMTLNVLWQVFTRFVLRDPSSYTEELARYLLIWVGLLGAAYASGKNMHLAIDVFVQQLKGRLRSLSTVFIQVCVLAFSLGVVLVGGFLLVQLTLDLGQVSAALQMKLGHVYLALPIAGFLLSLYAVLSLADAVRDLRRAG